MERTVEQADDLSVKMAITLEPAEVQQAFDEVYSQFKDEVQLPGFRKGKAPRKLVLEQIQKRMGKDYYVGSAIEKAVENSLREAMQAEGIIPYTNPHVHPHDLVETYKEGEPLAYEADFTRRPELPEFVYKGILVQIPRRELTEKDIDLSLENIRIRLGTSEPIEGRPAEPNDWAHIRLQAWHPDANPDRPPLFDNELDVQVRGGERTIPFLDDHLIGLQVGESTEATEVVPADFVQPPFPTDTALKLKITLMSLELKELPDLTDELVKEKLGVYNTIEELRSAVREQLENHLSQSRQEDLRVAVEQHILTTVQFVMPQIAVQNRYEDIKGRTLYQNKMEGNDLEAALADNQELTDRYETMFWDAAEKSARLDFISDTVAEREELKVTDQELSNYIYQMAQQSNLPEADVQKLFRDRNFLIQTYQRLVRGKAWWFMLTNAEVEEVAVSALSLEDSGQGSGYADALMQAAVDTAEALEALGDNNDVQDEEAGEDK